MSFSLKKFSSRGVWLLLVAVCTGISFAATAADFGARVLQEEGEGAPETPQDLVGHWRFTRIVFESATDEHLVLHADGSVEHWIATASGPGEMSAGTWSAEGKTLTISFEGDQEVSLPFTFYEGGLVFPNIPNQRKIWERIE